MAFKILAIISVLLVATVSSGVVQPITYSSQQPIVAVSNGLHYAHPAVDAVAATKQNVVRNFDGTVSTYSKSIATPYSSVRKEDTRITNNVYAEPAPVYEKYIATAPAVVPKAVVSAHHVAPAIYTHSEPNAAKTVYTSPVYQQSAPEVKTFEYPPVTKTVTYAAPNPATAVYHHQTPVVKTFEYPSVTKTVTYAAPNSAAAVYHHETPVAKTVEYPSVAKTVTYTAPNPATTVYHHEAPVAKTIEYPSVSKTVTYAAPNQATTVYHHEAPVAKTIDQTVTYAAPNPATAVYHHEAPVAKTVAYAAPSVSAIASTAYNHGSDATTYTHSAPGLSGYGSTQTVRYSPANMVSHMSFDGFGTHWGF